MAHSLEVDMPHKAGELAAERSMLILHVPACRLGCIQQMAWQCSTFAPSAAYRGTVQAQASGAAQIIRKCWLPQHA